MHFYPTERIARELIDDAMVLHAELGWRPT